MPDLGIGEAIALASVAEVGSDAAITAGVADGLAAAGAGAAGAGAAEAGVAAGVGAGVAGGAEAGLGAGAVGAGLSDAAITAGVADSLSAAGGGVLGGGSGLGGAAGAAGAGSSFGAGIPGIATGAPSLGATAPAGTSALGAGAVGDVGGAAGGFTLPSAAGTPGASAIGTGATEGSVSGFSYAGGETVGALEEPGFSALSPQASAELASTNPAGTVATNQAVGGLTPGSGFGGSAAPSSVENTIGAFADNPGFGTAGKALGANANWLVPAAGIGLSAAMMPSMPDPAKITGRQSGAADQLSAQGGQLLDGLNTGKLPAGAQATIDQASASAKAHIRSQYAGMGLAGSTMEQQALNQVDSQAAQQKFDMITKLVNTGLTETQMGNQIYDSLLKQTLSEDDALSKSISNFAASMAGGAGRPLVISNG